VGGGGGAEGRQATALGLRCNEDEKKWTRGKQARSNFEGNFTSGASAVSPLWGWWVGGDGQQAGGRKVVRQGSGQGGVEGGGGGWQGGGRTLLHATVGTRTQHHNNGPAKHSP
jgi:hypothetical protein